MNQQTSLIEDAPVKAKCPDILTIIARKKLHLEEPWKSCGWKRLDPDGLLVRIAQEKTISRGPRKGKIAWHGEVKEVFVSYAETTVAELEWEAQTGKCHNCGGDGQENCGWHHETGPRYRTCQRCTGSGVAPAQWIGASSPEPSSARTTADSPVAVISDAPNPTAALPKDTQ
jgi:hypothetical protein